VLVLTGGVVIEVGEERDSKVGELVDQPRRGWRRLGGGSAK
jgi:hypothetical protein